MNAEITVIMPVYNAGEYLREALDCVLAQDFTAYKLYCVDDCSNDGSYETLLEYEKKDERIQVFRNQKRMGAAYSRNFVLKMVDTKYVKFADADDVIDDDMFSQLYEAINEFDADIAYCEWEQFQGDIENVIVSSRYPESRQERELLEHPFCLEKLSMENQLNITNSPWGFMIRSAFIKQKNLEFQNLSSRNDVYFLEMAKMLAKKMVHTSSFRALVHQRIHQSISRIGNNPNSMDCYLAYQEVKNGLEKCGFWKTHYTYFISRCLGDMKNAIINTTMREQQKDFLGFLQKEGLERLGISRVAMEESNVTDGVFYLYECFRNGTIVDVTQQGGKFWDILLENREKIRELFASWRGKKIAFWGIGRRLEMVMELFKNDMDFSMCFIDTRKAGSIQAGRTIVSYEQVVNKNDIIILLNSLYENEIKDVIDSRHGKEQVFNLDKCIR